METRLTALVLIAGLGAGCSSTSSEPPEAGSSTPASSPVSTPMPTPMSTPSGTPKAAPAEFDVDRALRHVQVLAGRIGPRLATGPASGEAAAYVAKHLERQGYGVTRQRFAVPAGDSWGVPVEAGRSFNVVATPPGFDPGAPYRIVGAHLDTVAVAPGAEDNASGIAMLLELARLAQTGGTRLPTVLIAYGAEEPRGAGDALHHFGSQHHVRSLAGAARRNLRAMVSLDRVGVGGRVPVCTGGLSPLRVRDDLLALAERLGIPTTACSDNRASDHWSYEKEGYDVARLGSTPYAAYHSAQDTPAVIGPDQLRRTGRLIWEWLRAG